MLSILVLRVAAGLPLAPDPGPYDSVVDAIGDQVPLLLAALGAVLVVALGIFFFKWGVPQLKAFFKKAAN